MTFFVRSELVDEAGTVLHDETVVVELRSLEQIARDFRTPLGVVTFRLTFDPPLVPRFPDDDPA